MRHDRQPGVKHNREHSTEYAVAYGMKTLGISVCERTAP